MKTLVVGLTGPSNSGKTTFLKKVANSLREEHNLIVCEIEENVKEVFNSRWALKYDSLYDIVTGKEYIDFQFDVFSTLALDLKDAIAAKPDIIMTDRTFIDILFYTISFKSFETSFMCYEICSACLEYMNYYQMVISLQRLSRNNKEGIRKSFMELGPAYLNWEEQFFSKLIPFTGKYIAIKTKDLEKRIEIGKRLILEEFENERNNI